MNHPGGKAIPPIVRLIICNKHYAGKSLTDLSKEYGLSTVTIGNYIKEYDKDYAKMIDFLLYIIWYLQEHGYTSASKFLYKDKDKIIRGSVGKGRNGFTIPDFDFNYLREKGYIGSDFSEFISKVASPETIKEYADFLDTILPEEQHGEPLMLPSSSEIQSDSSEELDITSTIFDIPE